MDKSIERYLGRSIDRSKDRSMDRVGHGQENEQKYLEWSIE
jgi:hypothetical protein